MQNFFPLVSHAQPYEWGQIGSDSLVYQLSKGAGLITEDNSPKPFAELWMGDHPSLPSYVKFPNGEQTSLHDSITDNPERFLGKAYSHFGKKRLPFLFKVLSVRKTLSLQIHPSKEIAKELNQRHPEVYKDDNHKPEISIALSEFEALCNFRPYEEIVQVFEEEGIIRELLRDEVIDKFLNCTQEERKNCLENVIREFFQKDQTHIKDAISKLVAQIAEKQEKAPRDSLVLKLNEQFPYDIGVLLSYFLNYLVIQPGEAFVMDPCEPHAYIHGNCLEAMAASDNVIRGCLTPKYIDKDTLCKTLSYNMKKTVVLKGDQIYSHEKDGFELLKYPTPYEEFYCVKIEIKGKDKETNQLAFPCPTIAIVLKGKANLLVKSGEEKEYISHPIKQGESFYLLPESLIKFCAEDEEVVVYMTTSQCC